MTVYIVTREYGGPEEGGWWYNRSTPEFTFGCGVPMPPWFVRLVATYLTGRWSHEKHGDIYSVLGGVDVEVWGESDKHENACYGMTYE